MDNRLYTYKVEFISNYSGLIEQKLNTLGMKGWRLVTSQNAGDHVRLYFERELKF